MTSLGHPKVQPLILAVGVEQRPTRRLLHTVKYGEAYSRGRYGTAVKAYHELRKRKTGQQQIIFHWRRRYTL